MDERLKILEMIRDKKITPEEGAELLSALDMGSGKSSLIESFVDLHDEDQGPAKHFRITKFSKDGETQKAFSIPLGLMRFVNGLFPNSTVIHVNDKYLDKKQVMTKIRSGEKGVIYREDSEKGTVVIELV